MFFQLNITQLWSRDDEMKTHIDPRDSFAFYSSSSPVSPSFSALQAQENTSHLAKSAISNQGHASSGSIPVALWPQGWFNILYACSYEEILLPTI